MLLEEKLRAYFSGTLSKCELGSWAKREYGIILQGGYLLIEKMEVYGFLKTISRFHVIPDDTKDEYPCDEEDVRKVYDILRGNQDYRSITSLRIPRHLFSLYRGRHKYLEWDLDNERCKIIAEVRICIKDYLQKRHITKQQVDLIHKYMAFDNKYRNTLVGLLDSYAIELLCHYCEFSGSSIGFKESGSLYITHGDLLDDSPAKDILEILDYATGNAAFKVCIGYAKGVPDLFIL